MPIKMAVLAAVFGTEMCTGGAGMRASQSTSKRRFIGPGPSWLCIDNRIYRPASYFCHSETVCPTRQQRPT